MNSLALTHHLLLKDLRFHRIWLALVWVTALLLPVAGLYVGGPNDGANAIVMLGSFALFLLIFIVLVRAIRQDAPGRTFHFLSTRPVAWNAVLAEKALFIAAFLLVPVWILKMGLLFTLKIPVNAGDVALLFVECMFSVGALLAVVTFLSLFLRNLPVIAITMFGCFILFAICAAYFAMRSFHTGRIPRPLNPSLQDSKALVFYAAAIATVCLVAIYRYRGKSLLKPLSLLIAGLALSITAWSFWPYDFSQLFSENIRKSASLPANLRDHIKLTLPDEKSQDGSSLREGSWNNVRYINLNREALLEGVQPPYFATVTDYHTVATLKSGHTIYSAFGDINSHGGVGGMSEELRRDLAGFPPATPGNWSHVVFDVFHYLPDQFQKEDLTGARIKGTLTLEIRRAVVLKTIPFKTGGTVEMPRKRYQLQDINFRPDGVDYKLLDVNVASILRGDRSNRGDIENFLWLVFNRSKNEYLDYQSRGNSSYTGFFYNSNLASGTLKHEGDRSKGNGTIPEDWAKDAEITFFAIEPVGKIDVPFEIDSFDLKH